MAKTHPFRFGRRGFYFSMDVLLFVLIITFGFVLVLGILPTDAPRVERESLAADLVTFLLSTPTSAVAPRVQPLIDSGQITSTELSVFEQAAVFVADGDTATASSYLARILGSGENGMLPRNVGAEVHIYPYGAVSPGAVSTSGTPVDDPDMLISAKRVIFFYDRGRNRVIGPYIGEVRMW